MAYKIKWSPRAASNFEDICAHISKDSEYYASLFAKKVNALIKAIPQFPNPNESESVARVVYPPPLADHKGSALHFFAKNVKIFLLST